MGQLFLVAAGALGEAAGGQKVMGAAVGSAARRVAPFRIRHGNSFLFFTPLGRLSGSASMRFLCP
jgi:hypothetical protein